MSTFTSIQLYNVYSHLHIPFKSTTLMGLFDVFPPFVTAKRYSYDFPDSKLAIPIHDLDTSWGDCCQSDVPTSDKVYFIIQCLEKFPGFICKYLYNNMQITLGYVTFNKS